MRKAPPLLEKQAEKVIAMSSVIKVSAQRMTKDGEAIAASADSIAEDIRSLAAAMKNLSACWEGPAWNAFQNEVNLSLGDMEEVCKFFSLYLEELNDAKKVYRRCETENRNRIRRVRI